MSLSDFVEEVTETNKTLTVFVADEDDPVFAEVERFFGVQNVTVRRQLVDPDGPRDFVVLHQDGDPVAVSTLSDLRDSLFLRGADSKVPSDASLAEGRTPDVVRSMGNTTFTAAGGEAMLLTQISHHVLELAHRTGRGRIHVGIGPRSSLEYDPERTGAFGKLADAGVEVHLYGPGADGVSDPRVEIHDATGEGEDCRFAVFDGGGDDARKVAMVAIDPEGERYSGFWTFEAALVDDVLAYLESTYGG